ncbi:sodium-coupled neutral amino acid transporter 9 homolog isoform X3 [Periplaneta americana]|uniref:sodium-coupled neutral amino acid transporter 9 homolog isoform X3 n=1 Tax=Periplaneta americana TaxID=6978 RepID=UPI0037E9C0A6
MGPGTDAPPVRQKMFDRAGQKYRGWKPHNYSDYDSGSESHPLMSSDTSQTSHTSFGATAFMFPDSETSDLESAAPVRPRPRSPEFYNTARRPFLYPVDNFRKNDSSWEDQMSAITYNRFQYYSKLRAYALDDNALIIPNHVVPFTYFVPYISGTESRGDGKQGSLVTIFAVWNTIMGSSLLTMPWGMQNAGLLMGIITIVAMGGLCLYTAHKILQVQMHHETVTDTADFSPQNGSEAPPSVLCPLYQFYNEVPYNTSVSEGQRTTFDRVWNLTTTVPIFLVFVIGPLINFRSVTFFTKFNSLGTLSVMYILVFVIIKSASFGVNVDFRNIASIHFTPVFQASFPALSGMASLSFFIHNIIITIMRNNRHQEKNTRDLSIAYMLVTATYAFIGIIFYICFPLRKNCISDNLLNNFQNWDPMTVIARAFLFFQLITVYPLIAFMLRSQFFMAVTRDVYPGFSHVMGFNAIIVTICVLFAVFLPSIGTIIRYTGALCGLLYIFTLPILLHLASKRASGKASLISTVLHLIIPVIGAINLLAQFFV